MAETVYNITIPSTSATISYSPYVIDNANSGGWQSICPTYVTNNGTNSWICDPDSTHTTSSFKASFQFSFDGVGIYLVGNTTHNLGYDISLDGAHFPGNFRSNMQSLFSSVDLEPGLHTISLTVRQPVSLDSPGSITLKEVVVNAGTGRSGATVSKKVLDDNDQSIAYYAPPGGNWTIANAYPRAVEPEGLATFVFHDSYWTNATATIGFKGAGISVYGACYSHSRYAAYSASIDGSDEIQYDGTINLYSIGGDIKQRAGNCLRYFKAGLDAEKDHQLVLKVKDMGRLAVDWVEIYTVEGGQAIDNGQGGQGGSPGINNNTRVAIIAGAISGGVVLMLALLTILVCLRQRRPGPQDILTPLPSPPIRQSHGEVSFASTPFMLNPSPGQTGSHGASVMPPSPQPQTPAPSTLKRFPSEGPPVLSYSLGRPPLGSPGLSTMSSYTGSTGSGSGWLDSAGYLTTSFNYTAPLGPSISRPSAHTGRMGSSSLEPGIVYVGGSVGGGTFNSGTSSGPGYQIYPSGMTSPVASLTPPYPPAYEQIQVPGVGRTGHDRRVR
ncbi:unnamed protein product [Rhizoctonia solani]|uniref:Uncharacterized protein n=1 Tax=Rhizoctonia solani TaxID=456999 RepID=A0A8H3B756_9AGAM|nr:unnamed protein product [Rhizoctonia solani]